MEPDQPGEPGHPAEAEPTPMLPPEEDERIRRLLAEARHTEPAPDHVVERLDRVLADLSRRREERLAPVVELASRRRRTAASLLVAAAAVVVAGVGISQVLPIDGFGGGSDQATTAEGGAAADSAGEPQAESQAGEDAQRSERPLASAPPEAARAVARVRSEHFGADVRRARVDATKNGAPGFVGYPLDTCPTTPEDLGEGTVVPVTYDNAPAYLVYRPPAGDTQIVDLFLCGDTRSRRSITLMVP